MPARWPQDGATRAVFSTRLFTVEHERLLSPSTGDGHDFFLLDCADWCNIVALTPAREVVMVRQYRYGTREETLELPGGMIDPGDESPLAAARRELLEETGFHAPEVVPTGVIAPNPALQRNRTWSFLARDVTRTRTQQLDLGEDIDVVLVPLDEVPERVARGDIAHALVVVAFAYALGLRTP